MTPFVTALIGPVTSLISEFITDKDKANELAYKIATRAEENAHAIQLAQIDVNKTEAASKSVFVAGWRPFTGWSCSLALANNYLITPYVTAFTDVTVPTLDLNVMLPVLLGMLGLGGMRSWEKSKGVAREK
jgi:hypothetical protein